MLKDVREYIDRLPIDGHTMGEAHDDDPVLLDTAGRAVDTYRASRAGTASVTGAWWIGMGCSFAVPVAVPMCTQAFWSGPHQLHRQIPARDRRLQTPTTPSIVK